MENRVGFYLTSSVTTGDLANPRTLVQIQAAADHRITILGLDIGLQGATPATTSVPIDFVIQTGSGTGGAAVVPQKVDRGYDESILGTFLEFGSGDTEPTLDSPAKILIEWSIHQQGHAFYRPPRPIVIKGGERVGLRYKSGTSVAVSWTLHCEQ